MARLVVLMLAAIALLAVLFADPTNAAAAKADEAAITDEMQWEQSGEGGQTKQATHGLHTHAVRGHSGPAQCAVCASARTIDLTR